MNAQRIQPFLVQVLWMRVGWSQRAFSQGNASMAERIYRKIVDGASFPVIAIAILQVYPEAMWSLLTTSSQCGHDSKNIHRLSSPLSSEPVNKIIHAHWLAGSGAPRGRASRKPGQPPHRANCQIALQSPSAPAPKRLPAGTDDPRPSLPQCQPPREP